MIVHRSTRGLGVPLAHCPVDIMMLLGRLFDEGEEIAPRRLFLAVQPAVIRKSCIGPQIAGGERIRVDPAAEERFDARCGTTVVRHAHIRCDAAVHLFQRGAKRSGQATVLDVLLDHAEERGDGNDGIVIVMGAKSAGQLREANEILLLQRKFAAEHLAEQTLDQVRRAPARLAFQQLQRLLSD